MQNLAKYITEIYFCQDKTSEFLSGAEFRKNKELTAL